MRWNRGSLALITHFRAWNACEMGTYPRMRSAALSWPSDSLTYTSGCRILSKLALLTKRSEGLRVLGSAISLKLMKIHFSNDKKQQKWKSYIKSNRKT